MSGPAIPHDARLRVIPDVHGEAEALAERLTAARRGGRFVVQLGDLVDRGPDSARALALMLDVVDAGDGVMIRANHEWKIVRALRGHDVELKPMHVRTLAEFDARPGLAERLLAAWDAAPAFALWRDWLFVHGAWHPAMTDPDGDAGTNAVFARALYGQTTGRCDPKGRPERIWNWVDDLPAGRKVIVGHDRRADGVVLRRDGALGGAAYLLDLGCGKGGPLAVADLDPDGGVVFSHPTASWVGATYEYADA